MGLFFSELLDAISLAAIYFLISLGITLVFGLTRIVNFAQGQLVLLGAFVAYACAATGIPIVACVVIAMVAVGIAGEALDLGVFRRTLNVPLNGFVASLGLITALQAVFALIWPGTYYTVPLILNGDQHKGAILLSNERLLFIVISLVCFLGAVVFLGRTHYGRGIRAIAEDRAGAQALGVNVRPLTSVVFIVGSAMAGGAGALLGTVTPFNAVSGSEYLIIGFAVAVVGGFGSVAGTAVASLLLGAAFTFGAAYISTSWSYGILLVAMVVMIVLRPRGLVGASVPASDDPMDSHQNLSDSRRLRPEALLTPAGRWLQRVPHICFLLILLNTALLPVYITSAGTLSLATAGVVNAIAAYSVWLPFRLGGMLSLAQASLIGVGAYTTAYLAAHTFTSFWLQVAAAVVVAGLTAGVLGAIALRTSGSYFVVLVLALSEILVVLMQNLTSLTGGLIGTVLAKPPVLFGGPLNESNINEMYVLVFCCLLLVIGVLAWIKTRRFGLLLTSLRDNSSLASSLGLRAWRYKLGALCLAGMIAGLAGALTAYVTLGIDPSYFENTVAIQLVLMVIVGGAASLAGPLVGAMVITFLPIVLPLSPYESQIAYGLLLVVIILAAPGGISGLARDLFFKVANRSGLVRNGGLTDVISDPPQRRSSEEAGLATER